MNNHSFHLRGTVVSGRPGGGYRVQRRDGAQRGKEGVGGSLVGAPGIFTPNRNQGSRWGKQVVPEGGSQVGFWDFESSLGGMEGQGRDSEGL